MKTDILFRNATKLDFDAAGNIQTMVLPSNHKYQYKNNIYAIRCINIVAELNGKIIGFGSMLLDTNNHNGEFLWQRMSPYLAFIGTDPEFQKRGVGTGILNAILKAARKSRQDATYLFLEYELENEARTFYQKCGFEEVSRE